MPRPARALVAFCLWPVLVGVSPRECEELTAAHRRLLDSSFTVKRQFRMTINGDLKKREVTRLTWVAGELESEVLESESLSKGLVLDGDGKDFALEARLVCERLESLGGGRVAVTSEDGLERVVFELDSVRGALRPIEWRLDTTERFLFKKLVIAGRAEYEELEWR